MKMGVLHNTKERNRAMFSIYLARFLLFASLTFVVEATSSILMISNCSGYVY